MQRFDFRKYWNACIRWKGWRCFANGCKKVWNAIVLWRGWSKLFFLPFSVALILFAACGAALLWAFT